MKKRLATFKLNRNSQQRSALFRDLLKSLIQHEAITTTTAKAKAVRPIFERLLTTAKKTSISARRQTQAVLQSKTLTKKLFQEIVPRYADSRGGYTSLTPVGNRSGDNAPLAKLALTKRSLKKETPVKPVESKDVASAPKKSSATKVGPQPEKIAPAKASPKLVRRTGKRGDK